jgi:hypothetical protein
MAKFTYPYIIPTITVIVPDPIKGDSDQHENQAKFGISMSSRVYSYIKTPTTRRLLLSFSKLSDTMFTNLKRLIYESGSGDVGYLDHESNQWKGNFLNDPFEGIDTKNYQTITVEFKGIIP